MVVFNMNALLADPVSLLSGLVGIAENAVAFLSVLATNSDISKSKISASRSHKVPVRLLSRSTSH